MIYLSVPYSSADSSLRLERVALARRAMAALLSDARVTVCPVLMNHDVIEQLETAGRTPSGAYWRELETRLSGVCDELLVLKAQGWAESRGVNREVALFEAQGKPIGFLEVDEKPAHFANRGPTS